ncbi:DUF475 domain-containing protein [Actinoplanes philippinensis]|uniref:DUF475 domain-containing protein n=1 Tax=Actinoplanes philippinensis TaxID=35752 RepID=UPI000B883254|nr:DUF475 domain-containing protein [Actinoplanes philippinensis]
MVIRVFGWSFAITLAALAGALILGGPRALALVAILCVLEISVSFDNAVVNATVLERMNAYWQRLFLTVGIVIAVFGMRLVFPLLLVGVTAQVGPVEVIRLALAGGPPEQPGTYAALLHHAHPSIAAYGGTFLLMLFLDFVFEDRAVSWLAWLERPLARIGKVDQLSVVVALVVLVVTAETLAPEPGTVMVAGSLGIMTYLLVNGLGALAESKGSEEDDRAAGIHGDALTVEKSLQPGGRARPAQVAGKAAFYLFLYLEVLDASFSFDGVIGAFAISQDIFVIAAGLGVGAMYIRSITIYLVRKGSLDSYAYLEHGAHWAIGALAAIMLISIRHEVPEVITGLVGLAFIGAAMVSSVIRNRHGGLAAAADERRKVLIDA